MPRLLPWGVQDMNRSEDEEEEEVEVLGEGCMSPVSRAGRGGMLVCRTMVLSSIEGGGVKAVFKVEEG